MHGLSKVFSSDHKRGFTFIELIIVVAIIATGYVVLMPNFNSQSASQVLDKLNRLGSDVRSAFDLAILNHKPYRIVFHLSSGTYWLEETGAENFSLGSGDKDAKEVDLSDKKEKEKREEFNNEFEKYTSLAGEVFKDSSGDYEIPPMSPLLKAKTRLQRPIWTRVNSIEWGERILSPQLIIKDMKAEHHTEPVTLDSRDPADNYAHLYFLPSGYVERAYIHLYYLKGDSIDESQQPWTIVTHPYRGEASSLSGLEQVDLSTPQGEE